MRFKNYLNENGHNGDIPNGHITNQEARDFEKRWANKLKPYGVTAFELSTHFGVDRLNHKRNKPPLKIKELDFVLEMFLKKMGNSFKKDVEAVKNHTAKPRGMAKKEIPYNNLEFGVISKSTNIRFIFVLKQDRKQKGTAIVLPITIKRDKKFKINKGEEVIVERRELWI